jgi:hypothetical protein
VITEGLLQPGDVLAIRTGGFAARMIRFGAALRGKPDLVNHIAIVHHQDAAGTLWCIEGRPGGVGWADAAAYVASPWTISNAMQPKTPQQRQMVCDGAVALIGTAYDWEAIAADAAADLDLSGVWHPRFRQPVPGHVVCSTLALVLYLKALIPCPAAKMAREVQPADWEAFFMLEGWA